MSISYSAFGNRDPTSYLFFRGYWAESGGSDKPGFKELVASLMFKRDLGARKALAGAEAPHAAWGLCFMVWMEKKDRLGQPQGEWLDITWVPTNGKFSSRRHASGSGIPVETP